MESSSLVVVAGIFLAYAACSRRLDGTTYVPSEIDASLVLAPDEPSWNAIRALVLELAP